MLTQKKLHELLVYSQDTGLFTWKATRGKSRKNLYAGSIKGQGYIGIRINGVSFYAHRLAWLYVYGSFPKNEVDHINSDKSDNRIINLREATRSLNEINKMPSIRNKSGCRGVQWHSIGKKWVVRIMKDGQDYYLGLFEDLDEAINTYNKKRLELFNGIGGFSNEF